MPYTGILIAMGSMLPETLKEITERVNLYALGVLAPPRYEHSLRVAILSREMAERYSVDPVAAYLAGIAHDMCKSSRERWLLAMALKDGLPIQEVEEQKPSLLHGRAAAVLLQSDFAVEDDSILDAVRHHTFGAADMDSLGKIVFVADKIEPGRTGLDPDWLRRVHEQSLDGMTRMVLEHNIGYLDSRGKSVSPVTRAMLASLQGGKRLR